MKKSIVEKMNEETRVFKLDSSVNTVFIHFSNRYGIVIAGHMYLPAKFDANNSYRAVVVSGPFGAVKEQSSGLYAQEMAKHGYISVAFDPSFTGESGGNVRNVGSPEIYTEDYSVAVNDKRIKAVATSAMYDMSSSIRDHYEGDYYTAMQREAVKEYLAEFRWKEAETGKQMVGFHEIPVDEAGKAVYGDSVLPKEITEDADSVTRGFFDQAF